MSPGIATSSKMGAIAAVALAFEEGLGDLYPTTNQGRVVAAILMLAGVGLFGSISAFLASWFLSPELKGDDDEIRKLAREIQELRALIEAERKRDAA